MKRKQIDINDYSYNLPESKIAKYPNEKRDNSKLLIYNAQDILHTQFNELPSILPPQGTIVYNNTRVIHARIKFHKKTGAKIEVFCLSPYAPSDYQVAFEQTGSVTWQCMVGNLKKWKDEKLEVDYTIDNTLFCLTAEKDGTDNKGNQLIKFTWNSNTSFAEVLNATGTIPIPPYLNRDSENIDTSRYQTIYSQFDGSVAAPTAGLHFTPLIFEQLTTKGIALKEVTLHVGAGTFQPVKAEDAREHKMHGEQIVVTKQFMADVINKPGKIIATGTTSMRTLESLYWLGVKTLNGESPVHLSQWEWEDLPKGVKLQDSFTALLTFMDSNELEFLSAVTEIMIVPGYDFKVVDMLITNFHQPKSTLLLLIAAFIGEKWKDVYNYALENDFRFLSYGDSSLLIRKT